LDGWDEDWTKGRGGGVAGGGEDRLELL